ncbi:MAG: hypothetical protein ABIH00_03910 [Armatimonadota bacterium]
MYENCFLCRKKATLITPDAGNERIYHVECETCGSYVIDVEYKFFLDELLPSVRANLSGFVRAAKEYENKETVLTWESINEYLDSYIPVYHLEKVEKILTYIEFKTNKSGGEVKIEPHKDYPLAFAMDEREMLWALNKGVELGCLKTKDCVNYTIEANGREKLKVILQDIIYEVS